MVTKPTGRPRGRPRKLKFREIPIGEQRGRPRKSFATDPHRYAIAGAWCIDALFHVGNRQAANVAVQMFLPTASPETIRSKLRRLLSSMPDEFVDNSFMKNKFNGTIYKDDIVYADILFHCVMLSFGFMRGVNHDDYILDLLESGKKIGEEQYIVDKLLPMLMSSRLLKKARVWL
jgi:hypothetical protein